MYQTVLLLVLRTHVREMQTRYPLLCLCLARGFGKCPNQPIKFSTSSLPNSIGSFILPLRVEVRSLVDLSLDFFTFTSHTFLLLIFKDDTFSEASCRQF